MGILRLLLAFFVVISHTQAIYGFTGMGGSAVPAFFIISGFYMHLVLTRTYTGPGGIRSFYINRLLRLLPMYWATLFLVVVFAHIPSLGSETLARLAAPSFNAVQRVFDGSETSLISLVPNFLIIGSDVFRSTVSDAHYYLLVPQIWSVSNEMVFYAICPLLVPLRTRTLLVILALAYAATYAFRWLPWNNVLPTANFWFFVLGLIAFRALPLCNMLSRRGLLILSAVPFALGIFWQSIVALPFGAAIWIAYACCLPALFHLTKSNKLDARLGELSYPVYLCHLLVAHFSLPMGEWSAIAAFTLSCTIALILIRVVDHPIERVRDHFKSGYPTSGPPPVQRSSAMSR